MTAIFKTESQLQADFWKYVWNKYPQLRHHMWSVPNDAIGKILNMKDIIQANKMKSTGMLEGVWDLHLFWKGPNDVTGILHIIESKLPGQQLTNDWIEYNKDGSVKRKHFGQKEWGERMAAHGAVRHIYHNLQEGDAIIKSILSTSNI